LAWRTHRRRIPHFWMPFMDKELGAVTRALRGQCIKMRGRSCASWL
jgi:hypothetical protein